MYCHNCSATVPNDANFCLQCGQPFNRARHVITIPIEEPPPAQVAPVYVTNPKTSNNNGLLIGVSIALVGLLIGGTFAALYWFNRPRVATVADNTAPPTVAVPTPTPKPRLPVMDNYLDIEPGTHTMIPFSVSKRGLRLVGGLVVQTGEAVDVFAYPSADYETSYPTNTLKPIHLEQVRNKRVNQELPIGNYALVFENNTAAPLRVAAEFWLE